MTYDLQSRLQERVKELSALHQAARILQADDQPARAVMQRVVAILPPAWQYPSLTEARVRFRGLEVATARFEPTPWMQRAAITVRRSPPGEIEIAYRDSCPPADEGPFLAEERALLDSLAEMLGSYFERMLADEALQEAHASLEHQVRERTDELARANEELSRRLVEQARDRARIERYQLQLRQLAAQLVAVQASERRAIADDLHDHIGQALALIRLHIARLQSNATFCGFEDEIGDTLALLNQTIRYTRDLTSQISPPVLYELGLASALHWLADNFRTRHGLAVRIDAPKRHRALDDALSAAAFKAVQELLTNVVKHAGAGHASVRLEVGKAQLEIDVADDGAGFDVATLDTTECLADHFGLFSIREQMRHLGGDARVDSSPGLGTRVRLRLPC